MLINHLKAIFEPYLSGQKQQKSPLVLVFSILKLVQSNYSNLKPNFAGQVAEKTAGDEYHDSQYRTLLMMVYNVCKNEAKLFSKNEQIALLIQLAKAMAELAKVVSYDLLIELSGDKEVMLTMSIDLICFQNSQLDFLTMQLHQTFVERFDSTMEKTELAKDAARKLIKIVRE